MLRRLLLLLLLYESSAKCGKLNWIKIKNQPCSNRLAKWCEIINNHTHTTPPSREREREKRFATLLFWGRIYVFSMEFFFCYFFYDWVLYGHHMRCNVTLHFLLGFFLQFLLLISLIILSFFHFLTLLFVRHTLIHKFTLTFVRTHTIFCEGTHLPCTENVAVVFKSTFFLKKKKKGRRFFCTRIREEKNRTKLRVQEIKC